MKRLILFDIDGTLLTTDGAAKRAFHRALLETYGVAGPIGSHEFDGKTDPQIARELLVLAGLSEPAIDRGLPALWPVYLRELANELARPGHRTRVLPGVGVLLDSLDARADEAVVGLLTGNVERGASLKLASCGLNGRFRLGAYGSDRERREELPAIAVQRAAALLGLRFAGRDVIVIGDTPRDIACGQALGARCVGVATGRHGAETLARAGADVVWADLSGTLSVVDWLLAV